jgi:ubiquitin carboxyl-terminal hydrolase 9/24
MLFPLNHNTMYYICVIIISILVANIEPYARSIDARSPKGWIVDLINRFGYHGGFQKLLDRFQQPNCAQTLTVPLVYSLVR